MNFDKVIYTLVGFIHTTGNPTGRKFSSEFKFCYFPHGEFDKFTFAYYFNFGNLSMIAYIIEMQKSKFANI